MIVRLIVISLMFIGIGITSAFSALTDDNQVYYSFDNVSGNSENYGVTGIVGKINGAMDFDGTDDSINPGNVADVGTNDFSISTWVYYNSFTGGTIAISDDSNPSDNKWVLYTDQSDKIRFLTKDGGSSNLYSTGSMNTSQWYHVVATREGSTGKIYINGNLNATGTTNSGDLGNSADWGIGYFSGTYLDGYLDEFTYYDDVLNSSEVSDLYNSGTGVAGNTVATSDIVYYNSLDQTYDQSNNSNNGETNNGVTSVSNGLLVGAMDFDGSNDYIDNSYTTTGVDFSFCSWINPDVFGSISAITDDNTGPKSYLRLSSGGVPSVKVEKSSSNVYVSSTTLNTGEWTHLCYTWDDNSDTVSLYINGILDGSNNDNVINLVSGDLQFEVGRSNSASLYFDGKIDEVGIWNSTLDSSKVSELYNSGSGYNPYDSPPPPPAPTDNFTIYDTDLESSIIINTTSYNPYVTMTTNNSLDRNDSFDDPITAPSGFFAGNILTENVQYGFFLDDKRELPIYVIGLNTTHAQMNFDYGELNVTVEETVSQDIDLDSDGNDDLRVDLTNSWNGATGNFQMRYIGTNISESCTNQVNKLNLTTNIGTVSQECNYFNISLTSLAQGSHTLNFTADQTISGSSDYNSTNYAIFVDSIAPVIDGDNFPTEQASFTLSNLQVNFTETNLQSCTVYWSEGANSDCNQTTFSKVFTTNGLKSYNITVLDIANNSVTQNGTVLINPSAYLYFQLANGSAVTNFTLDGQSYGAYANITFYNDIITVNDSGPNNLTFAKLGFISEGILFNITTTNSTFNKTFTVSPSSINIDVFDRETGNLITDNVTLTLVGPSGDITTTVTGEASFSDINFIAGDYQVIASSANYFSETVYFTFNAQDGVDIDMYMLATNATDAGTITVIVKNSLSEFIEEAVVSLLEWDPSTSSYKSVAQGQTNVNGQTVLNIEIGTKLYKFQAVKGTKVEVTNAEIIQTDGSSITITLEGTQGIVTDALSGINYNFNDSLVGNVSTVSLYFNDPAGSVTQGCIKTYSLLGTSKTLLSPINCTSSSTGLLFKVNNVNNTYDLLVEGGVTLSDGRFYPLGSVTYKGTGSISKSLIDAGIADFLPLALYLIAIAAGIFIGNIYIGIILGIVMSWFSVALLPSVLAASEAVIITVLSILMLWGGFKRK